jgi:uncharacterized membrane protein YphA (DoxX/SURF4 family)
MTGGSSAERTRLADYFSTGGRWLLGGLFIYMGLSKATDPVTFLKLLHQYKMMSSPLLLSATAAALPWFECICGLLLITGVAVRGAAFMSLLMLLAFTPLVLKRALELQAAAHIPFCMVKFDCGCGAGEVWICRKLTENALLMLVSAWLLFGRGRAFSLRYELLHR